MTLCSGRMKNNIYLPGVWKHGWALDLHTLSSKKLGEGVLKMNIPKLVLP